MRRTWIKLFCDQWLRGSIRKECIEVRAIFADLLAMAGDSGYGDDGLIQLAEGVGFTDELIAGILNVSAQIWLTAKKRLIDHPDPDENRIQIIPLSQGYSIKILNWTRYQSEYRRQKPYRDKKEEKSPKPPKEEKIIEGEGEGEEKVTKVTKEVTKNIYSIINHWNSKGIKALEERETEVKEKTQAKIKKWLKNYAVNEIKDAIDNYDEILESELYYFSHRWQLWEFMDRGLINFLVKNEPRKNYLRDNKEYYPSQAGRNTKPLTEKEKQYGKVREIKLKELQKKYEKEIEKAMRKKDKNKLDEIDNKIKVAMAMFSKEYHES